MQVTEVYAWQGRELVGSDGEKIGTIKAIYEDSATGQPEWALVSSGLFGTRSHFVPLVDAEPNDGTVRVNVSKNLVKDAPSIEGEGELSDTDEQRLFEHYNVPFTSDLSPAVQSAPATGSSYHGVSGDDVTGSDADDAMTRSEEELRVGTAARERGRARLRKYVVTEQIQQTVPVQREQVRVEREPISDADVDAGLSGPEIAEAEHEVVLHEEEPVVEKRTVPKERVRLGTETVTEEREISEEVRKEQIEPEGDIHR